MMKNPVTFSQLQTSEGVPFNSSGVQVGNRVSMMNSETKAKNVSDVTENTNTQKISTMTNFTRPQKKYKIFSYEIKRLCLEELKRIGGNNIKEICHKYNIPPKSLRRWIKVGPERQKGAGRKIRDPNMEKKLMDWYNNYHCKLHHPINSRLIRKMAMNFSSFSDFRASKGWLEKFKKRYHIKY